MPKHRRRYQQAGSLILGVLGFAAGFLGPLVFTPDASQGPLVGLFLTGPLVVALVFILGTWMDRRHPGNRSSMTP